VWLWDFLFGSWRERAAAPPRAEPCAAPAVCADPPADPLPDDLELLTEEPAPWWVPAEEPMLAPPCAEPEAGPVEAALAGFVEGAVCRNEIEVPALPRVAARALAMLRNDEVDFGQLAEVVCEDPALAARVLQLVNSAAFARMFKVDRLETAFAWLGCKKLRSAVLAVSLKTMLLGHSGSGRALSEEIWQHSIICAALLSYASERFGLSENEAFLSGLLHDIGKLVIVRLAETFQQSQRQRVPPATFRRLCEEWHEPLGHMIAAAWQLQSPLPEIIGEHHAPLREDDPLARQRALVQFANTCCALLGYSGDAPCDFFNLPSARVLGLTDDPATQKWLAKIPALVAEKTGLF